MPGVLVDGQDALAMYEATKAAVARARAGDGPSLIEGRTYRYEDHSEGLQRIVRDPYRTDEEIEEWRKRDPIELHKTALVGQGVASQQEIDAVQAEVAAAIEEALEFARQSPYPEPEELTEDLYANPIPIA
jgi:pyruvate dehydrogenase E1 component alpha subunit